MILCSVFLSEAGPQLHKGYQLQNRDIRKLQKGLNLLTHSPCKLAGVRVAIILDNHFLWLPNKLWPINHFLWLYLISSSIILWLQELLLKLVEQFYATLLLQDDAAVAIERCEDDSPSSLPV